MGIKMTIKFNEKKEETIDFDALHSHPGLWQSVGEDDCVIVVAQDGCMIYIDDYTMEEAIRCGWEGYKFVRFDGSITLENE